MLGLDNPIHILFILILLLLVFGAKRLPEMGRSLGTGLRGFKESISGDHDPASHLSAAPSAAPSTTPITFAQPVAAPVSAESSTVHSEQPVPLSVVTPMAPTEPVLTGEPVRERERVPVWRA
jgi:sec-independent protein translocase protein TatA